MTNKRWIGLAVICSILTAATFLGYRKWNAPNHSSRDEILALLPTDANAIFFADVNELRPAPFLTRLFLWAAPPQADPEYAQFVKETGFDYERDLNRIAIAFEKRGQDSIFFAALDGKFDRQKITAYVMKDGSVSRAGAHEIYSVPGSGAAGKIFFSFLKNDRVALTNDSNLSLRLDARNRPEDIAQWRTRFERLAGSPVFAVIRQDAALGTALDAQAPGGLRSPQLSTLLDQLQWITIAGKPENDRLRLVAEGECAADATARQLTDVLNGVAILAENGLNDPKTRQQLDPTLREAYLDLLKNADVSKLDRGDTKSVRLVLEISSAFLEATRKAQPIPGDSPLAKPRPSKTPAKGKGHT